jgi:hypothetical protein
MFVLLAREYALAKLWSAFVDSEELKVSLLN